MLKKLISLNLALLLLLSLLSVGAAAAEPGQLYDPTGKTVYELGAGEGHGVMLHYLDGDERIDLTESSFDVSSDIGNAAWNSSGTHINISGEGLSLGETGTITAVRKADGAVFTMQILVVLPMNGFFRTDTRSEEAFLGGGQELIVDYQKDPSLRTVYYLSYFPMGDIVLDCDDPEVTVTKLSDTVYRFVLDANASGSHTADIGIDRSGFTSRCCVRFRSGAALLTQWSDVFSLPVGSSNSNLLYLEDGTQLIPEDYDLSADICPVLWNGNYARLDGSALTGADVGRRGTLTAVRRSDGAVFTMPITVDLPWMGWFSSASWEAGSFAASSWNEPRINYAAHPEQRTLHLMIDPRNGDNFGELTSVTGSSEVTVTRLSGKDILVELSPAAAGVHSVTISYEWYGHTETRSLTFTDGTGLVNERGVGYISLAPEASYGDRLFTEDGQAVTEAEFDLSCDLCPVRWQNWGNGDYVFLDNPGLPIGAAGTLTATRRADGKVFSMPIEVVAPWIGWYSSPAITAAGYLGSTQSKLIWNYGSKGLPELFVLMNNKQEIVSGEADSPFVVTEAGKTADGHSYLRVTLDPAVTGTFETRITLKNAEGNELGTISAVFTDGTAMFTALRAMSLRNVGYGSSRYSMMDGDRQPVTPENYPKLSVTEGLGRVFWNDEGFLIWDAGEVGAGLNGTVTAVSADGSRSLTIPVYTTLPDSGFYSEPRRANDTYLRPYNYSGAYEGNEGRTVYFMAISSGSDLCFFDARSDNDSVAVTYTEGEPGLKITLNADASGEVDAKVSYTGRSLEHNSVTGQDVWSKDIEGTFRVLFYPAGTGPDLPQLGIHTVTPPQAEIGYAGSYSGYGQPVGTVSYILPKVPEGSSLQVYTGDLVCTDPSVMSVTLYDPSAHIWQITTLTRTPAWLKGEWNGKDYYIEINPGGEPVPGERMYFDMVTFPHPDYQIDEFSFYTGFGVSLGETRYIQLMLGDVPVNDEPDYDHSLISMEKVTDCPVTGVFKVTGLKGGEGTITVNGSSAVRVRVNVPQVHVHWLERVEAVAPTATEPGNIAYLRCPSCGRLFAMPELRYTDDAVVTRAMAARLLADACGWEYSGETDPFTDVDESLPEYEAILMAAGRGVMSALKADEFGPNAQMTRAELAVLIFRVLGGEPVQAPEDYAYPADWNDSAWYNDAELFCLLTTYMSTDAEGRFDPHAPAQVGSVRWELMYDAFNQLTELREEDTVLSPVLPGDVTGNGTVEQEDVTALFLILSGEPASDAPPAPAAMDVNEDGRVNNCDAILLFRRLAGLLPE